MAGDYSVIQATRCKSQSASCHSGFSLVELMVAIAIAGIVMSIATPWIAGFIRGARLSAQSDLMVTSLMDARQQAIKLRSAVSVCAANDPANDVVCSQIVADWQKGWIMTEASGRVLRRVVLPDNVSVVTTAVDGAYRSIKFAPVLGSVSPPSGDFICISVNLIDPATGSEPSSGAEGWPVKHRIDVYPSGRITKSIGQSCS